MATLGEIPHQRSNPLRSPSYRLLLAGQTVSSFGSALTPIALAFAVLELGGSATQLGLVVMAYAGAEVATVLFGGILGDRLPRRLLMQGSAALSALTQALIAVALIAGWANLALLAGVGLVNGCVSALSIPSTRALISQTVPADDLPAAVSLRRLSANAAMVAGFGAGGVLVAALGSGWAIAIDAASFVIAAICFSLIRVEQSLPVTRESALVDLKAGATEVFRHTWLWVLIGQALIYHLFYGGVQGVLGPIVVGEQYGEAAWGWSLSVLMLGFMVGGLVTLRFRPRRGLFVGVLFLSLTACFPAALALHPALVVVLVGAFLHGFGLEIFSVAWDLSIQRNVAPDKLARVYSFDLVGSYVARPLGLAVVGPVGEAVGYSRWLAVVAGVMFTSSLLASTVPSVRRLHS